LTLGKINKIGATRCQILKPKCTQFDFRWGSTPDPAGRTYSAPHGRPLAVFKEPTSKGLGKEGRGRKGGRKGKERVGEGKKSSKSFYNLVRYDENVRCQFTPILLMVKNPGK